MISTLLYYNAVCFSKMRGTFFRNVENTGILKLHCIYHCFIFYHIDYFQISIEAENNNLSPKRNKIYKTIIILFYKQFWKKISRNISD